MIKLSMNNNVYISQIVQTSDGFLGSIVKALPDDGIKHQKEKEIEQIYVSDAEF